VNANEVGDKFLLQGLERIINKILTVVVHDSDVLLIGDETQVDSVRVPSYSWKVRL
jgi:hypothetical protein